MKEYIVNQISKSIEVKQNILKNSELIGLIENVAQKTIDIYKEKGKILIAGNGGSAADAQHIAGEFVSRFYFDR